MIIIPMAGLSSRFFKAGYTQPKYMLDAHGMSLFDHAVSSFKAYFSTETFLFIVRDVYQTPIFVKQRAKALGIQSFSIVTLTQETRGQAETVYLGLQQIEQDKSQPITIFNIDTFRPDFIYPDLSLLGQGYLEVFKGSGDNWSFARPRSTHSTEVVETAEKRAISDLCCTGLYHFAHQQDFETAYQHYLALPQKEWEKGELYIAPMYNFLINNNQSIHYHLIDRKDVIFCGIPSEYDDFKACRI
ncbi:capsular biosynthesis protein [Photobacterium angustum]|uniref:Capsular biosynthesis protein n=1 Tax=Photobacterium angustum TaxID=661 RepID=A0A855S977_PHOAN|nr:glycosyltransferase family 2 protein [Photobacterium angustum]KJF81293.1 capsular biosynthesis protein [Photobacterium damselae subsp. damselae]KJG30632.1 capsular biosynthesis protein [Photobacterium angustum]KJG39981.1 capsular biosynthesis protein [Photobacterium angustum]KJG44855.1 capsular biosynthesis protein [Photobacterium angustum]KJG48198.1 capsular biosynthesis protein [Photobacterium angustum]